MLGKWSSLGYIHPKPQTSYLRQEKYLGKCWGCNPLAKHAFDKAWVWFLGPGKTPSRACPWILLKKAHPKGMTRPCHHKNEPYLTVTSTALSYWPSACQNETFQNYSLNQAQETKFQCFLTQKQSSHFCTHTCLPVAQHPAEKSRRSPCRTAPWKRTDG